MSSSPQPAPQEPVVSVHVVVPEGVLWSGDARSVTVPSVSGALQILARHEPVAAVLRAGRVRVRLADRSTTELHVTGGFVVVDDDEVTVIADGVAGATAA